MISIESTRKQALSFSSRDLWDDPENLLATIYNDGSYPFISERLRNDESFLFALVQRSPYFFRYYHSKFRANKKIVLEAVTRDGSMIEYASEALKSDLETACAAVRQNAKAFCHLSDILKNDFNTALIVALNALNTHEALKYVSSALRNNRQFMRTVIQKDRFAFRWASTTLKDDFEFRSLALASKAFLESRLSGYSLDLTSKESVLAAVTVDGSLIEYIPEKLKNDSEIARAAVNQDGELLCHLSDILKNDFNTALIAALNTHEALKYVSSALRNNRQFMRAVIQKDGRAFRWASTTLKDDLELLCLALATCSDALQWASENLKSSKKAVLEFIKLAPECFPWVAEELKKDREVVLAAIQGYGNNIRWAASEFRADKELMLIAINNFSQGNNFFLSFAANYLRADAEVTYADYLKNTKSVEDYQKLVAPKLLARIHEYATQNQCPLEKAWGDLAYQEKIRKKPYQLYTEGATLGLLLCCPLSKKLPDALCFYIGSFLRINSGGWQMSCSNKKVLSHAIFTKSEEAHQNSPGRHLCDEKIAHRFFLLKKKMHTRSNMFYIAGATESVLGRSKGKRLLKPVTHLISTFFVFNQEGGALALVDKESAETARRTRQTKSSPVIR